MDLRIPTLTPTRPRVDSIPLQDMVSVDEEAATTLTTKHEDTRAQIGQFFNSFPRITQRILVNERIQESCAIIEKVSELLTIAQTLERPESIIMEAHDKQTLEQTYYQVLNETKTLFQAFEESYVLFYRELAIYLRGQSSFDNTTLQRITQCITQLSQNLHSEYTPQAMERLKRDGLTQGFLNLSQDRNEQLWSLLNSTPILQTPLLESNNGLCIQSITHSVEFSHETLAQIPDNFWAALKETNRHKRMQISIQRARTFLRNIGKGNDQELENILKGIERYQDSRTSHLRSVLFAIKKIMAVIGYLLPIFILLFTLGVLSGILANFIVTVATLTILAITAAIAVTYISYKGIQSGIYYFQQQQWKSVAQKQGRLYQHLKTYQTDKEIERKAWLKRAAYDPGIAVQLLCKRLRSGINPNDSTHHSRTQRFLEEFEVSHETQQTITWESDETKAIQQLAAALSMRIDYV